MLGSVDIKVIKGRFCYQNLNVYITETNFSLYFQATNDFYSALTPPLNFHSFIVFL